MQILDLELGELAARISAGEISARAATLASLEALDRAGRALNCTVDIYAKEAIAAAGAADEDLVRGRNHGRLHGVPMAHKDLFDVAGRVVAAGSKVRKSYRAVSTASAIRSLAEAGAINVGALHMSELALSPTGYNQHLGPCRNPWNPDFVTGGSSSGSAAAVAARLVPASLGSDTGGSARIPAAACGVTGLKPTYSLVAKDGVTPLAPSLDCVSPIARSAADCALLLDVIAGPRAADAATTNAPRVNYSKAIGMARKPYRIGVLPPRLLSGVDSEVAQALDQTLAVFRRLGMRIEEIDIDGFDTLNVLNRTVLVIEAATLHRRDLAERPNDFSGHVRSRLQTGLFLPATRYLEAITLRGKLARQFVERAFATVDLVFMPCLPIPVPAIASDPEGVSGTGSADIMDFTRAMNYLGVPAISIPAGFTSSGLPASFQLVARHFEEARLLAAAHWYQQETDWHRRQPPAST